jgi:hypothetical protein
MAHLKSLLLIGFLAGGLLLVRAGALPLALYAALALLLIVVRMLPRLDAYSDELQVGDEGVVRQHGSRLRKTTVESVRWDQLRAVEVRTRETGPQHDQMLFLMFGREGSGVAVPEPLARQHRLAETLARRLPGWRQDLLAQAMAATEPAAFTLWEAGPQEG